MPLRQQDALGGLAAVALGAAAFLVFCGWWVLIPTNIAWLTVADRAMHQLGWMFFREGPWGIPPGASPLLGIEVANSIALADGLPLFALPFKLISAWLPQPFQYWGYWLLLSFILQSVFAYRIARELEAGRIVALCAAAFALITPAFLFRVPMHLALSGHWLVLAALYLNVRRVPPPRYMWPLLAVLASAIHAYLLVMVLGLWAAAAVQRLWLRRMTVSGLLVEMLGLYGGVGATLWLVGFFGVKSIGSLGYGYYKLNLAWPVIPYRWSTIFPAIDHARYDYEGLSFLGIGILALLLIAILSGAIFRIRSAVTKTWLPLVGMLVLMMLFAFSMELQFAGTSLVTIPAPKLVDDIGAVLRSTGRFVWPLLYFITIGTVVLVGGRFRAVIAVPLLVIAFSAQAVDSAPAWRSFAEHMAEPAPVWPTPLTSPFWQRAADAGFTRVRAIPSKGLFGDWKALGYYALTHHMDTDAAYLGRYDQDKLDALEVRQAEWLDTGNIEPHTIYVIDMPSALRVAGHLNKTDLLATINDRIVLAKDGAALVDGLGIMPQTRLVD